MRLSSGDDPVDSGQQLEPERRLEALHQVRDALEAGASLGVLCQQPLGILRRTWHQLQFFVGRVATISVAGDEIAFDLAQDMAQILGVRSLRRLSIAQA